MKVQKDTARFIKASTLPKHGAGMQQPKHGAGRHLIASKMSGKGVV